MPTNFRLFVYIIVKGSWAKVGSDIFTSLKMTGLQSWSIDFFLLFHYIKRGNKINVSTSKTCHFKASRDITTNFGSGALDNNVNKWPKADSCDWPPFWQFQKGHCVICLLYGLDRNMTKGVSLKKKHFFINWSWKILANQNQSAPSLPSFFPFHLGLDLSTP